MFLFSGQVQLVQLQPQYWDFTQKIVTKLNDASDFTGYIDNFGYNGGSADHDTYPVDNYIDVSNFPFPIDGTDDDIDLDLKEQVADYGGTTIKTTYNSFTTVLGVLVGGATAIPRLTDVVAASTLTDNDAEAVVQKLLELLPK